MSSANKQLLGKKRPLEASDKKVPAATTEVAKKAYKGEPKSADAKAIVKLAPVVVDAKVSKKDGKPALSGKPVAAAAAGGSAAAAAAAPPQKKDEAKKASTASLDDIFADVKAMKAAKQQKVEAAASKAAAGAARATADDDDMGFSREGKRGSGRKQTEEGYNIYTEDELRLGGGGDTALCPWDCDCCFG